MTEAQQIKKNANEAFVIGDYPNAFSILWKLGVDEFLQYAQKTDRKTKKNNWLAKNHKKSNCKAHYYFWNNFILQKEVFTACFSLTNPIPLLYNYYSRTDIFNEELEVKLAKNHPEIFIEAIRKNQVFFKENRISFLLSKKLLSEEFLIHQDVWRSFQKIELNLWNEISSTLIEIEKHSLEKILFYTVEYFETNNFNADFETTNRQILAENYSFFIELILSIKNIKQEGLDTNEFVFNFTHNIYKKQSVQLRNAIFKCLNLIEKRQNIDSVFFQPYCYNNEFQPKYIYQSLYFYESPKSHYQWYADGIRYVINESIYKHEANSILNYKLKNGAKIKSINKEDYKDNVKLAHNIETIFSILNDLELTHYYIKGYKEKKINIEKIILPIIGFSYNKYIRYYKNLENLKYSYPREINNWHKALAYLLKKQQTPFVYKTKQEYLNLNRKSVRTNDNEIGTHIINQFSFNRSNNFGKFNRFNIKFSVIDTPFIVIDDYIFSPVLFFINFSGAYTYINSLLKNNHRYTAKKIEKKLADILKLHGFNLKIPSSEEVDSIDGDTDLIVYDDKNVLLIQLKRTRLRLNYEAQFNEYVNTDLKASNQLKRAEKYFSKENPVFEIKNRKTTKWIVSNSFEKVNTKINNCLKVNYLDIISFSNNLQEIKFNNLSQFLSFYEQDIYFKTAAKDLLEYDRNFNQMLSITNINKRNLLWRDINSKKAKKYRRYYEDGVKLHGRGDYQNSIKSLRKCLKLENNDFEIHASIANVYADLKNFEKAFYHYNEALKIVPNEPLTKLNLARTLQEIGDENWRKTYNEILDNYPLLDL